MHRPAVSFLVVRLGCLPHRRKRTKPMRSVKFPLVAARARHRCCRRWRFAARTCPSCSRRCMRRPRSRISADGICVAISGSASAGQELDWFSYPTLLSLNQIRALTLQGIFGISASVTSSTTGSGADVTGQYRGKIHFHGSDVFVFNNAGVPTAGVDTYTASKS